MLVDASKRVSPNVLWRAPDSLSTIYGGRADVMPMYSSGSCIRRLVESYLRLVLCHLGKWCCHVDEWHSKRKRNGKHKREEGNGQQTTDHEKTIRVRGLFKRNTSWSYVFETVVAHVRKWCTMKYRNVVRGQYAVHICIWHNNVQITAKWPWSFTLHYRITFAACNRLVNQGIFVGVYLVLGNYNTITLFRYCSLNRNALACSAELLVCLTRFLNTAFSTRQTKTKLILLIKNDFLGWHGKEISWRSW